MSGTGAFNYFSMSSNIVDINKQALSAHDAQRRVFGRMLLALTDEGGVLAFHPHARNQKVSFAEITKAFAQDLAASTGTVVVASRRVTTLVASRWYDDGPVVLAEQLSGL